MKLLVHQHTTDEVLRRLSLAKRIVALEVRASVPPNTIRAGRDRRDTDQIGIVAIFRKPNQILLAQRRYAPEAGKWALPGGHIHYGESLEAGTRREVQEEVGLSLGNMKEIRSWRTPDQGTVHLFYAHDQDSHPRALSETRDVMWSSVHELPEDMAWNNHVLISEIHGQLAGSSVLAREQEVGGPVPNLHLTAQDVAIARYRNDVRRFIHVVEADVARKKRKTDDLILYWLMLMEDSERSEFEQMTQRLAHAQALPFIGGEGLRSAAESFAQGRASLLRPFAEETHDLVREGFKTGGLAGARKAGENVLTGSGERVAVTEAVSTYGGAQIRLLKDAGFTHKAWNTMEDDRVRDSHRQCESQGSIPIGDAFHNGLQYPGDPAGGPEEVCNCRCWLTGQGRMNQ